MTVSNYFVSEMKVNRSDQKILLTFIRIPTKKEKEVFEARQELQKKNNRMPSHFAMIFRDPYGESIPTYDLAFSNIYMILSVSVVKKKKLSIGSVVAFNVPENQKDVLKPVNIDE